MADDKKSKMTFKQGFVFVVVGALFIGGCMQLTGMGADSDREKDEKTAIGACEANVRSQIVDPSSATFSGVTATRDTETNDYAVAGFVSGEAADGSNVRRRWTCQAEDDGSQYLGLATIIE
jgi:hypothetical protein